MTNLIDFDEKSPHIVGKIYCPPCGYKGESVIPLNRDRRLGLECPQCKGNKLIYAESGIHMEDKPRHA